MLLWLTALHLAYNLTPLLGLASRWFHGAYRTIFW